MVLGYKASQNRLIRQRSKSKKHARQSGKSVIEGMRLTKSVEHIPIYYSKKDKQLDLLSKENHCLKKQIRCLKIDLKKQEDETKEKESKKEEDKKSKNLTSSTQTPLLLVGNRENETLLYELKRLRNAFRRHRLFSGDLCRKFLQMKNEYETIKQKYLGIANENREFIGSILKEFDECRIDFSLAENKKVSNQDFSKVVSKNARLLYDNTVLQYEIRKMSKLLSSQVQGKDSCTTINSPLSPLEEIENEVKKGDGDKPGSYMEIYGSVISVPLDLGEGKYRMTPMFEAIEENGQPKKKRAHKSKKCKDMVELEPHISCIQNVEFISDSVITSD